MIIFGAGAMYGTPLTDAYGNAITTASPIKLMAIQEMALNFDAEIKQLHGEKSFALVVAKGKTKVTGSVKAAKVFGSALNSLYFGTGMTAGTMTAIYSDEVGTAIPASSPYTITPTLPNSGTAVDCLGVLDANGVPMTRVSSSPATGQYSYAAGMFTFAAADTGLTVYPSLSYSYTLASAKRIDLTNTLMGAQTTFKAHLQTTFQGKRALVILESVLSSKLALLATKTDDFSIPSMDFEACCNAAGTSLGTIYIQE